MPSFNIKYEDRVRLRHMLDAALEIQQYISSSTREDLDVVWETSTKDIPTLIEILERYLK